MSGGWKLARLPATVGLLLAALVFAACASAPRLGAEVNREIKVFGVELGSDVDHRTLGGETAEREPCLHGYEYDFDKLGVRISYDRDGRVRAITTRNAETAAFGVKVGETEAAGGKTLLTAGFAPASDGRGYVRPPVRATLLVNEAGDVFGLRVELTE